MSKEKFGSRFAVVAAMAGSAIGLGNIWRFPYVMGENGGAVFVLIYLCATVLVSLPIFLADVIMGRRSETGAYGAMYRLSGKTFWKYAGLLPMLVPLIISSYYSVVGGWSLKFLGDSMSGFIAAAEPSAVTTVFSSFVGSGFGPVAYHLMFMGLCAGILALGVKSGIEKFSTYTIPTLFVLIIIIIIYSVSLPGSSGGVKYLLVPDLSALHPHSFAAALGQSFYSMSLGMGAIITYGVYVSRKENILASSAGTAFFDLCFAVLAGFAIMPAVFSAGLEAAAGPGLIFQSIPYVFSMMGEQTPLLSSVISTLFFVSVLVAAITSNISLMEVGVSFLGQRFGVDRKKAILIIFITLGTIGIGNAIFSEMFNFLDTFCSNVLLLISGMLSVVFVGWVMKKEDVWDEFTNSGTLRFNNSLFESFYFLLRYVAPLSLALIFITNFMA